MEKRKKQALIAVLVVLIVVIAIIVVLVIKIKNTDNTDTVNANEKTTSNIEISEDYFEWEDNIIVGLTEEGMKQTTLTIPARCESIEQDVFVGSGCVATEIIFESDEDIDIGLTFCAFETLEVITLPNGLTEIPNFAFEYCYALKEIVIPANVTTVGKDAFSMCNSLKSVIFEGGTELIGESAFYYCKALESVKFCDTISEIGKYAFYGCESLTNITLPEGLKTIDKYAFNQCGFGTITVPEGVEVEDVDDTAFWQDDIADVYVVEGSWADENFNEIFYENGKYEKLYQ